MQGFFNIDVTINVFYNLLHRDHTHSALPPQTTAATMTTFEAIQTAAAARSASSNGFSMMSASEVAKRDMIKKITATASTTGPTTATVAAIKSRRSSAPLASAASNSTGKFILGHVFFSFEHNFTLVLDGWSVLSLIKSKDLYRSYLNWHISQLIFGGVLSVFFFL